MVDLRHPPRDRLGIGLSRWLLNVCVAVGLAACVAPAQVSDLQRTWTQAAVFLPPLGMGEVLVTRMGSNDMAARLAALRAGTKLPVVLYMHGCTGIGNEALLRKIAAGGFAVIAPDSFARAWRPLQCSPATFEGGYNVFIYDFRLAEVAYALDQMWASPWADSNRLVLVGSSEGAVAAALYRGDEFAARVIAQWTCSGAPHVAGLAWGGGEPVLALLGARDPWYLASSGQHCGHYLVGRPNSRSEIIAISSDIGDSKALKHDILSNPDTQSQILGFIDAYATPGGR